MAAQPVGEFEAVILAGGPGRGLYPLTTSSPKALLPIANRPLLWFQLDALSRAGLGSAIVACSASGADAVRECVARYPGSVAVEVFEPAATTTSTSASTSTSTIAGDAHGDDAGDGDVDAEADSGTLSVLRQLRLQGKLHSDVLVLSGDVVTTTSVLELADVHRVSNASITMLLQQHKDAHLKQGRKSLRKLSREQAVHHLGFVREGEVEGNGAKSRHATGATALHGRVVMMETASPDDPVEVPKRLLWKEPRVFLHSDLVDLNVYILRRWVVDALCSNEDDVVSARMRGMSSLAADLVPFVVNKLQPRSGSPEMLAAVGQSAIRCCAVVADASEALGVRANTVHSYMLANNAVANFPDNAPTPPWPQASTETKAAADVADTVKGSLVAASCKLADNVVMKNCVIGANCSIGDGCMLSNSVLMDNCSVGPNCVVQNSVAAANVVVAHNCKLNNVQIQSACVVPPGLSLEDQAILASDFTELQP